MNYRQVMAIEKARKNELIKKFGNIPDTSGIYMLTRTENGFKYAYIGQTKRILSRLAEHLKGYEQHIDRSIKKHKLYNKDNLTGWDIKWMRCEEQQLNELEQYYIKEFANAGYQLRNKTSGSQGQEKSGISENKTKRGFYEGVAYGYKKAQKEIAKLFERNLIFEINGKINSVKERYFEKFSEFLKECGNDEKN